MRLDPVEEEAKLLRQQVAEKRVAASRQKHNKMHSAPRLNDREFEALKKHVSKPKYSYMDPSNPSSNKGAIDALTERFTVPKGQEMYRALTPKDLAQILEANAQGKDWKPGIVRGTVGSGGLNEIGASATPIRNADGSWTHTNFGGKNDWANTVAKIEAAEPLKGILDLNRLGDLTDTPEEHLLGPKTRYKMLDYIPGSPGVPGVMRMSAYANNILGPLGYLMFYDQAKKAYDKAPKAGDRSTF